MADYVYNIIAIPLNIIITAGPKEERPIIRQMRIPPSRPQPPPKPQPPPNMLRRPLSEAVVSKPKPQQKPNQDASTVKAQRITLTARDTMQYWYRPQYSRDEAVNFLRNLDPGSFILRDSSTVSGGSALTIKVSPELIKRRKKMPEGIIIIVAMYMYISNNNY